MGGHSVRLSETTKGKQLLKVVNDLLYELGLHWNIIWGGVRQVVVNDLPCH